MYFKSACVSFTSAYGVTVHRRLLFLNGMAESLFGYISSGSAGYAASPHFPEDNPLRICYIIACKEGNFNIENSMSACFLTDSALITVIIVELSE